MSKGSATWFNDQKGCGFIQRNDGDPNAFDQSWAVGRAGPDALRQDLTPLTNPGAQGQQFGGHTDPGRRHWAAISRG
ncbi:MAG TPA: hypothetical protein VE665_09265 [Hyphomicrobiaceae bacterium]|jgi:cold shock CspA family protein|nr:hypothetical protein [Hyphomicrobiaceae bacterium]